MLLPTIADLVVGNEDWEVFAFTGTITTLIGVGLYSGAQGTRELLSTREAFIMTSVAWLVLSLFGAIPYLLSGVVPTFTDAVFESMSAITTTGSTVITGLDNAPPGILLWRGIQQWLGGLGIIVMAVAVLPMLQVGGMQLFKVEAFDTAEKIMPRARQISGSLTLVFIVITLMCILAYLFAGMSFLDAAVHGMTTVATGGFSTKDASMGYFDGHLVDVIAIFFMILGSIPFILYVQAYQGRPSKLWRNSQVKAFLTVLGFLTMVAWLMHPGPGPEGDPLSADRSGSVQRYLDRYGNRICQCRLRDMGTRLHHILLLHNVHWGLCRIDILRHQDLPVPGHVRSHQAAPEQDLLSQRHICDAFQREHYRGPGSFCRDELLCRLLHDLRHHRHFCST